MAHLEQALVYGSLTNVTGWNASDMIARLVKLVKNEAFTSQANYRHRLYNNYYQCLIAEPTRLVENHQIDGQHALLLIQEAIDSEVFNVLATLYLSQCPSLATAITGLDTKLVKLLLDTYQQFPLDDELRAWYISANRSKPVLSKTILLGLPTPETKSAVGSYLEHALQVDNLKVSASAALPTSLVPLFLQRVKLLAVHAPEYWTYVMKAYARKLNTADVDFITLRALADLPSALNVINLPSGLEAADVVNFTPATWELWKVTPTKRAYTLGFPIHLGTPGTKALKAAIFKLARDGPAEYAKAMTKQGSTLVEVNYEGLIYNWKGDIKEEVKDDDLLGHPCSSYGPFDRLTYVDDDQVYEFTRPSWKNLLKKKQNPYNKNKLTEAFLKSVEARLAAAEIYGLCDAKPLSMLLEDTLKPQGPSIVGREGISGPAVPPAKRTSGAPSDAYATLGAVMALMASMAGHACDDPNHDHSHN